MKLPPFGSVYKITCLVNGKVYIGLTRSYVSNRWHQHRKEVEAGTTSALYHAMRKHGIENFRIDAIASALSADSLGELESILIAQYDAYGRGGYNMSLGGERPKFRRMGEAGKERLRQARSREVDRAANSARLTAFMRTEEGAQHQARMVEAARLAKDKLAAGRRKYAATTAGAEQIARAAKLGAARKAELSSKAVRVDEKVYKSVRDAAEAFGIERGAVRWRIKSTRFKNWSWV